LTTSGADTGSRKLPRLQAVLRTPGSPGALAISSLILVANGINYLTNLLFSHLLSSVGYGELISLLAIYAVLVVPASAAQVVVAKKVASLNAAGRQGEIHELVRYGFGHGAALGLAASALYTLAIPFVILALHLGKPGPAIALIPLVFLAFIQPVQLGLLQGLGWFTKLGMVLVLIALSQMILGGAWVLLGGGAGAAIGGESAGTVIALGLCVYWSRGLIHAGGHGIAHRGFRRKPTTRSATAVMTFTAFALIANADTVLAKVVLTPKQAGIYAAIATVGKVCLFLPTALTYLLVPNLARTQHTKGDLLTPLRRSARWTVLVGLVVAVPLWVFPQFFVDLMFGRRYSAAASGVRPIVLVGIALALILLMCTFTTAIADRRWFLIVVGGIVLQVVGISTIHSSPGAIAWVSLVALLAVLVANEIIGYPLIRRPTRT
jgi:O-antigen/teichoic acid export membrane protein